MSSETKPESGLSLKTKRQIAWLWIGLVSAYFIWSAVNYRGLYERLAEFQLQHFNGYVPLLTFGVLAFIFASPGLALRWQTNRAERKERSMRVTRTGNLPFARRLMKIVFGLAILTAIVSAGLLLWTLFGLPSSDGVVRTVSVGDTGQSEPAQGPTRLVGGELGRVAVFEQGWFARAKDNIAYAPYREAGPDSGKAAYFVQISYSDKRDLEAKARSPVWNGILVKGGLPGTIEKLYENIGVQTAAAHYTLYASPAAMRMQYWALLIRLVAAATILGLIGLYQRRHIRRVYERQEPVANP